MPHDALQLLYPFLHGTKQDATRLDSALLDAVRLKAQDSAAVKLSFFESHSSQLVAMAHAMAATYRGEGRLFCMGNGGSSCDAAHIAVEFNHPITAGRPALPAINLVADTAMLTAVGNDVGIDHIFVRPLIAQARRGDGLIGVSTSGNSPNLIAAFATAKRLGVTTFGLSGHDGGAMASSAALDHCLVVASDSVHRIQETHVAAYHILWDLVHTLLADERGALKAAP